MLSTHSEAPPLVSLGVLSWPAGLALGGTAPGPLEADLAIAARAEALFLAYQPRISLGDGAVVGAEALLRWRHPQRGMVPPSLFIPVAEASDSILHLGGFALRQACQEACHWPGLMVSVNVSARQLEGDVLLRQVEAALAASGLPPERLELELTESLLVDCSPRAIATLALLRRRGIGIALDDFGTGYACLSLLKRLPLSVLKVDRCFIAGLPQDDSDIAIIRAVRDLTRALGLRMVAEGVETTAQYELLRGIGCDEAQGFLFGEPVAPALLRARISA